MAVIVRSAPYRIQDLINHGETKVCDPRPTGGVNEDVWLVECQCGDLPVSKTTTYPLETSMDHVTGVEVVEAIRDIR